MLASLLLVAACGGGSSAPPASAVAGSDPHRVAAIEKLIATVDDPSVLFVVFEDVSDLPKDGISRVVQLASTSHIEVLCDTHHGQCQDAATRKRLGDLGFTVLSSVQGAFQKDAASTPHAQALLTEQLFLQVLKAAPDYKLTYYTQAQPKPTALPVGT